MDRLSRLVQVSRPRMGKPEPAAAHAGVPVVDFSLPVLLVLSGPLVGLASAAAVVVAVVVLAAALLPMLAQLVQKVLDMLVELEVLGVPGLAQAGPVELLRFTERGVMAPMP